MLSRRAILAASLLPSLRGSDAAVKARAITSGPRFHWFGYYDKLQFDPSGRYVLGQSVDFEHRSPAPSDEIRLGFVDLKDGNKWTEIGTTRAWNWQQGCMLQYLPGSKTDVIWNDRDDREKRFFATILNIRTGKKRTLPHPVYALSPDAKWAIFPDFGRLNDTRPGYGYAGLPDPNAQVAAPDNAGLWRMNLETGRAELLLTFAQVAAIANPHEDMSGAKHWFNHLLYNTNGTRFTFLHRWRGQKHGTSWSTRMLTATHDGKDVHIIDPYGKTSHFVWRDPSHILAWTWHPSHGEKFYVLEDKTNKAEVVGKDVMTRNGHCTYVPERGKPGTKWILNDAYPDKQRMQPLYLYEVATERVVDLGKYLSPPEYKGEWRCDLHPRSSVDGRKVVIDSTHEGKGRQMYLVEIEGLTT